jgi:hypothetical protein
MKSKIATCHVRKPRCVSPAAKSLRCRIAECQVPEPRCLSQAANSLRPRIAECQVLKPRCQSPNAHTNLLGCARKDAQILEVAQQCLQNTKCPKTIVWGPCPGFICTYIYRDIERERERD